MLGILTGALDGAVASTTTFMASTAWQAVEFFLWIVILSAIIGMIYGIISRKRV